MITKKDLELLKQIYGDFIEAVDTGDKMKNRYNNYMQNQGNVSFMNYTPNLMTGIDAAPDNKPKLHNFVTTIQNNFKNMVNDLEDDISIKADLADDNSTYKRVMNAVAQDLKDLSNGNGNSEASKDTSFANDRHQFFTLFKSNLKNCKTEEEKAEFINNGLKTKDGSFEFNPYKVYADSSDVLKNVREYKAKINAGNLTEEDDRNIKKNIYNALDGMDKELQNLLELDKDLVNSSPDNVPDGFKAFVNGAENAKGNKAIQRMKRRAECGKKAIENGWPVSDMEMLVSLNEYCATHERNEHNTMLFALNKNIFSTAIKTKEEREGMLNTFNTAVDMLPENDGKEFRQALNVSVSKELTEAEHANMAPEKKHEIVSGRVYFKANGEVITDEVELEQARLENEIQQVQNRQEEPVAENQEQPQENRNGQEVNDNEQVEVEPVRNVNNNMEEIGRANPLNEQDIAAYENEVNAQERNIADEFEKIGFENSDDMLEGLLQSFNSDMYNDSLSFERTAAYKNNYAKILGRVKDNLADKNGPMGQAIDAQTDALKNNWGVNDMTLIRDFALSVATQQDEALKAAGNDILNDLKNINTNTVDLRNDLIDGIESYAKAISEKGQEMEGSIILKNVETARRRDLHYTEYPEDETVHDIANRNGAFDTLVEGIWNANIEAKDGQPGKDYNKITQKYMSLAVEHNKRSYEEKQKIREKGDYVMQKSDGVEHEAFKPNYVQNMSGITVSNRNAAKIVFGDNVFDGSDALHEQAEKKDRTVTMHNANGNKALKKGENVLEIDISGSGLHLTERDYHGFAGETYINKDMAKWEDPITLQYGGRVPVTGFPDVHSVRKKETNIEVNGKNVNKTRYTIPGPMPKPTKKGLLHGMLDVGKYKTDNSSEMALQVAKDYLTPIFNNWIEEKNKDPKFEPETVNLNMSGYSRGAVATGMAFNSIRDWVSNHPQYKQFADKVKGSTILFDPVPGPDGRILGGKGSVDFRKDGKNDPNMDVTVFHSLSVNHADAFEPQGVRGASRIILGTTMHACTQDMVDNSQRGIVGDGKTHRKGFFDTSTGECYRGSGISDLPKGVYFSDENQNLVRLTSFSQMPKLIKSLELDKESTEKSFMRHFFWRKEYAANHQVGRRNIISESVKNFMLDNPLDISYESEHERSFEHKKFDKNVNELLDIEPSRDNMSKNEVEIFKHFKENLANYSKADKNTNEARAYRQAVLKDAADLIRADKGEPETSSRLEKISDVYSILQRDMVYDQKGLTPSKGRQELSDSALKSQSEKANSRYEKFAKMQGNVTEISKKAGDLLKTMQANLKSDGSNNSDEYNKMYYAVKKVSELSADKSSISDIKTAFEDMYKASDEYIDKKTSGLFKTKSDFGKMRIGFAKDARSLASDMMKEADIAFDGISQTDMTINEHMEYQTVRINELMDIREKKQGPKKKVNDAENKAPENKAVEENAPKKEEEKSNEVKPEVKPEDKPEVKPEVKNEGNIEIHPEIKKGTDVEISKGAQLEFKAKEGAQAKPEQKADNEVKPSDGPKLSFEAEAKQSEPELKESKQTELNFSEAGQSKPKLAESRQTELNFSAPKQNEVKQPEVKQDEVRQPARNKPEEKADPTKAHNVEGWGKEHFIYDSNAAAKARQEKENSRKKISLNDLDSKENGKKNEKKNSFHDLRVESRANEKNVSKSGPSGLVK